MYLSVEIVTYLAEEILLLKYKLGIVYNMQHMCHIIFLKSKNISKFQNTSGPMAFG